MNAVATDDAFEAGLRKTFEDRAGDFSQELRDLLRAFWNDAYQEGHTAGFQDGHATGNGQLELLFTSVVRGRQVDEVFRPDARRDMPMHLTGSFNLVVQPWVMEAWQSILDAPDLKTAAQMFERKGFQLVGSHRFTGVDLASRLLALERERIDDALVDLASGPDKSIVGLWTSQKPNFMSSQNSSMLVQSSPSPFVQEYHGEYVENSSDTPTSSGSSPSEDDPPMDSR
jgi:hypothetical protein